VAVNAAALEEEQAVPSVPGWAKALLGGMAAIVAVSIAARLYVPEDGPRTLWSLVQLLVGLAVFVVAHFRAYFIASAKSDKVAPTDLLCAPIAVWQPAFSQLPETGRLVCRGGWGLSATLCALAVVGGIGFDQIAGLIAMDVPEKTQPSILQRVLSQARRMASSAEAEQTIEEALAEFGAGGFEEPPPLPVMKCVIIGYTVRVNGTLFSVLLASSPDVGPSRFVCKLPADEMGATFAESLELHLPPLRTRFATVACPHRGHWVRPDLACAVEYTELDEHGLLQDAKLIGIDWLKDGEQRRTAPAGPDAPTDPTGPTASGPTRSADGAPAGKGGSTRRPSGGLPLGVKLPSPDEVLGGARLGGDAQGPGGISSGSSEEDEPLPTSEEALEALDAVRNALELESTL
jgi:hypothetical protein